MLPLRSTMPPMEMGYVFRREILDLLLDVFSKIRKLSDQGL